MTGNVSALSARARAVWSDPARTVLTLESIARTETDGAADIARAAGFATEAWLQTQLLRHASDEARHGRMFAALAAERRRRAPSGAFAADDPDLRPISLLDRATNGELHGRSTAELMESQGEIAYVAMLHVAETRARGVFATLRGAWGDDPMIAAALDTALRDETYHVAYTRRYLDDARRGGRGSEVRRALVQARGARLGRALATFAARTASRVGRLLLVAIYLTVVPPFALFAKCAGDRARAKPRCRPLLQRLREQN